MNLYKPNLIIYLDLDNNFFDFCDYNQHSKITQDVAIVRRNWVNCFYVNSYETKKLMEKCLTKTYIWW